MMNDIILVIVALILAVIVFAILTTIRTKREARANPFIYPYKEIFLDITRKHNPLMEDQIDKFLMDEQNWSTITSHMQAVQEWKQSCEQLIELEAPKYVELRKMQYKTTIDDEHEFIFNLIRYRQTGNVIDAQYATNYEWLAARRKELEATDFSVTINEYQQKEQRRLMTPKLRKEIIERDKYTCQNCGKYMPDGIGIHVDHIVPIARGGKTIPSNLQVLCSKCNTAKGARTVEEATDVLRKIAENRKIRLTVSETASAQLVNTYGGEREASNAIELFAKQSALYGRLPFAILDKTKIRQNTSNNDYNVPPFNRIHPYKRAEIDELLVTAPSNVKQIRIAGSALRYSCEQNDPLIVVLIAELYDDNDVQFMNGWLRDQRTTALNAGNGELKTITINAANYSKPQNAQKYEKIRNETLRIK